MSNGLNVLLSRDRQQIKIKLNYTGDLLRRCLVLGTGCNPLPPVTEINIYYYEWTSLLLWPCPCLHLRDTNRGNELFN